MGRLMKADTLLLLQAAGVGALLAPGLGALAAWAGQRDVTHAAPLLVLPGALAGSLATALTLQGWHRAGGVDSGWPATRMAAWIVLHLLWILPALLGVTIFLMQSMGRVDVGVDVGGIDIDAGIGILLMLAAVGSAMVWGLPAYFLAWLGCRRFLARMMRASEYRA